LRLREVRGSPREKKGVAEGGRERKGEKRKKKGREKKRVVKSALPPKPSWEEGTKKRETSATNPQYRQFDSVRVQTRENGKKGKRKGASAEQRLSELPCSPFEYPAACRRKKCEKEVDGSARDLNRLRLACRSRVNQGKEEIRKKGRRKERDGDSDFSAPPLTHRPNKGKRSAKKGEREGPLRRWPLAAPLIKSAARRARKRKKRAVRKEKNMVDADAKGGKRRKGPRKRKRW